MPNQQATEEFLRERIAQAVASQTGFAVGAEEDETLCLVKQAGEWVVGYSERGRLRPKGRFQNEVTAAEFLILLLLSQPNASFVYPAIDWTGYASLPD